jgi:hypothetical protein
MKPGPIPSRRPGAPPGSGPECRRLRPLWLAFTFALIPVAWPGDAAAAISLVPVASGLSSPVAITHAGDGRLFITLQAGQIVIFDGAAVLPAPFLDIASEVEAGGERGLLSVAFHPSYAVSGFFYVYYTCRPGGTLPCAGTGDIVIARFQVSGNPNLADENSGVVLRTIAHPAGNHNGGQLQFGRDGCLYAGTGDGGGGGDPDGNGQNLNTLLGKLLRLDPNSGGACEAAPGNPFGGSLIWALGLRNPWRFSFDKDGNLFIGDVGEGSREEVDFQPAGTPGLNYCWNRMEGTFPFDLTTPCVTGTPTAPIVDYSSGDESGNCSITGGYRHHGSAFLDVLGGYIYGDLCSGRIWGAAPSGSGGWTALQLLDTSLIISTFGQGPDGTIYVADYGSGTIYRIVPFAQQHIEALVGAGVTAGCGTNPPRYCPDSSVTRQEMAAFVLRAREGPGFSPPACRPPGPFSDVPCESSFAGFIQALKDGGVVAGCGGGNYCPGRSVTRAEMAVFLVATFKIPL